jgi:hypothetical protein
LAGALVLVTTLVLWTKERRQATPDAEVLPIPVIAASPVVGTSEPLPGIPAGLSSKEWSNVVKQIQAERRAFHPGPEGGLDTNGPGGENVFLAPDGSAVVSLGRKLPSPAPVDPKSPVARTASVSAVDHPALRLKLGAVAMGRGNESHPAHGVEPSSAPVVAKSRDIAERHLPRGLTEWWRSEEKGIEFGWNVAERPAGQGELRLDLAVECNWSATIEGDGRSIAFVDPSGSGLRLAIQELAAIDFDGRLLPARMEMRGQTMGIVVDDASARYPITIDPWIAVGTPVVVNAPSPVVDKGFGYSVSMKGDVLVVGERDSSLCHIFTRETGGYVIRRSVSWLAPVLPFAGPAGICGDTVVAGPFLVPGYILKWIAFERNSGGANAWGQVQEFTLPFDPPQLQSFLISAAALGPDTLVLSTPVGGDFPPQDLVQLYHRNPTNPSQWEQEASLTGADLTGIGAFGFHLAVDGPTLVVTGLWGTSELRAFTFRRAGPTWRFEKQISFAIATPEYAFYTDIDLSGDTLVVGQPFSGGVQIFERDAGGASQWGNVRTVTGPASVLFGSHLDLDGDLLAVGTPDEAVDHDNNPATPAIGDAGVVRVYGRHVGGYNNWGLISAAHKGAAAEAGGRYGCSVALACGRLTVGYQKGDAVSPVVADAGTVEVYTIGSGVWTEWTVSNPVIAGGADFGAAVSVDGPYLLVGMPLYDPAIPGGARGTAYLFRDGSLVHTFFGEATGDHFGAALAVQRDRVVIAAPQKPGTVGSTAFSQLGKVYVYERNQGGAENWGLVKSFVPSDVTNISTNPFFGSSVALDGERIAVGAPNESFSTILPTGTYLGITRVFERNEGGASNWGQVRKLNGSDAGTAEKFGSSLALDGESLVVGAPGESVHGLVAAGAAYVFCRNQGGTANWGQFDKMTASPAQANASFGSAVAIDGPDLAVSAFQENMGSTPLAGAVYLFRRESDWDNGWSMDQRIQPEDLATAQYFGISLALSHGRVLIGGPLPVASEPSAAGAWLYARSGPATSPWVLAKKFTTSSPDSLGTVALDGMRVVVADPTENVGGTIDRGVVHIWDLAFAEFIPETATPASAGMNSFGASVSLRGDLLAAGAPQETVAALANAGAVYVLGRVEGGVDWELLQRLTDPDGAAGGALFGSAVAMDDRWLMIGVPGRNQAKVFDRSSSDPVEGPFGFLKTLSSNPVQSNLFGTSLAVSSERLLVGAPYHNPGAGTHAGAAFLFERNQGGAENWGQTRMLAASDAAANDEFGRGVALNPGTAVVGAPLDDLTGASDGGSAYVFHRNSGGAELWGQVKRLTRASPTAGDEFGTSVALADFLVLVGMPRYEGPGGTDSGGAVLFARNFGGAEAYGIIKTFTAPDGNAQARFGQCVALDTTHAVIGAPYADPSGRNSAGQIYIYSRNYTGFDAWGLLQTLCPADVAANAQFGSALSLDGTRLAAAAPFNPRGTSTGSVEIYEFRGRALYDEWLSAWGLTGDHIDPMADADGDGQENILEMAFGSDPGDPSSMGVVWATASGGNFTASFPKSGLCGIDGVLTAEVSTDLVHWDPASPAQIIEDDNSFLRIQMPLGGASKRFVRFRLDLP